MTIAPAHVAPNQDPNFTEYRAHEFVALFKDTDKVVFPKDKVVRVYDLNQEMCFNDLTQVDEENPGIVMDLLNDILLITEKKITRVRVDGTLETHTTFDTNGSYVELHATAPIEMTAERKQIVTKVSALLKRMQSSHVNTLNFDPKQQLILRLSANHYRYFQEAAARNDIEELRRRIAALFCCKSPHTIKGVQITVPHLRVNMPINNLPNAIGMYGKTGMRIDIIRE